MRGTVVTRSFACFLVRITPAHAGNSYTAGGKYIGKKDHPRSCGEQIYHLAKEAGVKGSPPLMRGTGALPDAPNICTRITPAHAGNSITGVDPPELV